MLNLSQLPDVTILSDGAEEKIELSRCGATLQWLSDRITERFGSEKRLGIIQPTSPALILTWLAALKAGKEPCILQYPTEKLSKDYWRDSIQHTICSSQIEGLIHGPAIEPFHPNELAKCLSLDEPFGETPILGDQIVEGAVIQLSSGTTGFKKGLRLTLAQLRRHVENYNQVMRLSDGDTTVSWLPLYHDMGFIACFVMPLMLKIPVVMLDPIRWVKHPETLFAAIRRHRGTICYMPNFGFEVMSRQPNPPLPGLMRHWISCSEPTHHQTLETFCHRTGANPETVSTCYGMAENVFAVTQSLGLKTLSQEGRVIVSCGKPIPGTQVKTVDGELYVKSDTSLCAYVGTQDLRDAEGYYATGDLGDIIDGEIVISGRKHDVMISAGKKYFLHDVDYVLGQILPESAGRIASVADYDRELGTETVLIFIERARFWENGDLGEISEKVKQATNLETHQIRFVPPFFITKTSSGKINRRKTLQDWKACQALNEHRGVRVFEKAKPSAGFLERVAASFPSLPKDEPLERVLDSLGTVVMRLICDNHDLEFKGELTLAELASRSHHAAAEDAGKVFSVVALMDGVKLGFGSQEGFITEQFIARLSAEVGLPVSVEHFCVPPAPLLFSDVVFHDYFMPRDLGDKYKPLSAVIQKIKNASLILLDDEDAFRLRDFCVYPKLSHRFNNAADADLLGHRLAAYTLNHHLLPREVVAGGELLPEKVTPSIRQFEAYLGVPIMKIAFHKQFTAFTRDWDYTQYRQYVSDLDYQRNPVNAADIQSAILRFICQRRGEMRPASGTPTGQLVLKDPPHFCSFLVNRKAVDFILSRYQSFCIGGLSSSVPYIEQRLKAQRKKYFYASTMNPDRTDYDCLLLTGFSGAVKSSKPYFDFLHIGDEGGKPHNVSPEFEKNCPSLVAGDPASIAGFRKANNGLVPIGNWILNQQIAMRSTIDSLKRFAGGTVVVYGPLYARSGYGLLARSWALAFHEAGLHVRVVPVDCQSPKADLDDCDCYLLRKLENTELRAPVTAIYAYVPIYLWPKMVLPEPNVRIMLTTFDSSATAMSPSRRLIHICNQMDQIWVPNRSEEEAWIRGGAKAELMRSFHWPNDWIDNPLLGPAQPKLSRPGEAFRFLHVSVYFPRRRLDVLIQAFFEEFPDADTAELYLKIAYNPEWHPVPGQPKRDLLALIEGVRRQTGSKARLILDDTTGTRKELARLYDSCDFYVSADTSSTAPVSEALFRCRLGIITDGWNVELPPEMIVVKNSSRQVEVTPEMAAYMPHHRGGSFPALEVAEMRAALRQAQAMPAEQRTAKALNAFTFMRERFSYAATAPAAIRAVQEAWQRKDQLAHVATSQVAAPRTFPTRPRAANPKNIIWCGLQLFYGKIPSFNRGICGELIARGHQLSLRPGNGPFQVDEIPLDARPEYLDLANRFYAPFQRMPDVNVFSRWHPIFREELAGRQIMVSTWSSGAVPADWVPRIQSCVDEVWVPSRHVQDNFLMAGVPADKLWLMPVGVDSSLFRPDAPPLPLKTKKRFKFLFVGETSPRKGFDLLLKAYVSTFSRQDDVCLVVKDVDCEDYYWRKASAEVIQHCQSNPQCPEVEYLDTMLGENDLPSLYAACDCFVQPSRCAGSPLAVLEAMACGLPVLTTAYGGALDICDSSVAHLLAGREVQCQVDFVGHWRVSGPQRHVEIEVAELQEKMRFMANHRAEGKQLGQAARQRVCAKFDRKKQVDLIEQRLDLVCRQNTKTGTAKVADQPAHRAAAVNVGDALPWLGLQNWRGSVLFVAPFYNRSGYGTGARAMVAAMHAAGVRVRIVPVDNVEPGIDDCDMAALKALESTPLSLPMAVVFFHVPNRAWLEFPLPENSIRIMFTTFDGSAQGAAPPAEWVAICNQMDQLWLMTKSETEVFQAAGVRAEKIKLVPCPHSWLNNSALPLPVPTCDTAGKKFRFLSIAMFLPRRRWDTLVEAFLTEFKDDEQVELYFKVNYPSWHPVSGQPQRDLHQMLHALRRKTGSKAQIIVDEDLGTRLELCRLIDSCHAYVSTDTASTAPLSEALVRSRMALIPDGYGASLPYNEGTLMIPSDPNLKAPITSEILLYQPHHKGKDMPLLKVENVRRVLRNAFELPPERRVAMGQYASLFMESKFGFAATTPIMLRAIQSGFEAKLMGQEPVKAGANTIPDAAAAELQVHWEGSFLDLGSLSHVNRELTGRLNARPGIRLSRSGRQAASMGASHPPEFNELAAQLAGHAPSGTRVTVRHAWPPDWQPPHHGLLVVIQPWEFGSLPVEWVAQAQQVQQFWVPSEHVRQVYVQSGVPSAKVKVVPNGIDSDRFQPEAPRMSLATRKSFKFLFVGGTIFRKGPDVLLDAYLKAFTAQDDVCLVIKDFGGQSCYAGQTIEARIKAAQSLPNAPEILYLNTELPPEALPRLYTACDCLVHPYRGEGFGLPILEAMACGLPVIVTEGGAADDFATAELAYRVPAQIRNVGRKIGDLTLAGEGWLLEPSVPETAARMRHVFEHRDEAKAKGRAASQSVRQNWTWERAAAIAQQHLLALVAETTAATDIVSLPTTRSKAADLVLPPCALVGHIAQGRIQLGNKKYRAAWESTLAAIQARPYHPEAYLLLAEIALTAGDAASARRCAQQARDLAPDWKPARKFLKGKLRGNSKHDWLVLPQALNPDHAPHLSVCLIVKNEEEFLGQCLTSVRGLADQIVVVDTGSNDRTVSIAKEHGAEVHYFAWCDDFSAARNAALEHATGDWVLMLDADEELTSESHAALRKLMAAPSVMAWRLPIIDVGRENEGCCYVPRLFRNAPALFYVGRVHEQVFTSIEVRRQQWGLDNRLGDATLRHHGYRPEVIKDRNKIERNLRLLEKAIVELPDEPNLLMNYGLELTRSGQSEIGLEHYRKAFDLMSAQAPSLVIPETREMLLTQFCTHLTALRRFDEIIRALTSPLAKAGGLTASLHFTLGLAHLELKQFREAADQMRQCLAKRSQPSLAPLNPEIHKAGPHHCLALCLTQLGDTDAAAVEFPLAMKDDPQSRPARYDYARFLAGRAQPVEALNLLFELAGQKADDSAVWVLGGQTALSRPEFIEVALDWTAEARRHLPQDLAILRQRAEALTLANRCAEALPLWRQLGPESDPALAAALELCETAANDEQFSPSPHLERQISQEFLKWYQRVIQFNGRPTIEAVNARIGSLQSRLPTAAHTLQQALAQASDAVAA